MITTIDEIQKYLNIKIHINRDISRDVKFSQEDRLIAKIRADAFTEMLNELRVDEWLK